MTGNGLESKSEKKRGKDEKLFFEIFTFSKDINWARLDRLVGWFRATGCVFDTLGLGFLLNSCSWWQYQLFQIKSCFSMQLCKGKIHFEIINSCTFLTFLLPIFNAFLSLSLVRFTRSQSTGFANVSTGLSGHMKVVLTLIKQPRVHPPSFEHVQ